MPLRALRLSAVLALVACGLAGCRSPSDAADPLARDKRTTGLDADRLAAVVARAEALPQLRALIVARDGDVLAEHYAGGYARDEPANIKSASKSVLSAVVGAAIADGVLEGVDQRVSSLLADDLPPDTDPRLAEITVGHLLSMQAGLEPTSGRHYGAWAVSPNLVRDALARPFVDDPGGRMLYSTGSSHLLSAVLTRASGESTLALARRYLGDPLGVTIPPWSRDAQGVYLGGNEMALSPAALLAFGEMYRSGGVHEGRRVLPEAWVRASWTPRAGSPVRRDAYGYGWWIRRMGGHRVFYAWGYGGQMVYVVPSLRLTVVMLSDPTTRSSEGGHLQSLHALLADGVIPAAEAGSGEASPA